MRGIPDGVWSIVDFRKLRLGWGSKHGVIGAGVGGMVSVAGEAGVVLGRWLRGASTHGGRGIRRLGGEHGHVFSREHTGVVLCINAGVVVAQNRRIS